MLIDQNIEQLKNLCITYHVEKMYLFGSSLTSNFTEKSDIDFLVKFKPIDLYKYFENYIGLKEKLQSLLGRDVDLLEEQTLRNPILIRSIHKSKKLIYG